MAIEDDLVDQIFDFMIRDFSKFALQIYSKPAAREQMDYCLKMIKKPTVNLNDLNAYGENMPMRWQTAMK